MDTNDVYQRSNLFGWEDEAAWSCLNDTRRFGRKNHIRTYIKVIYSGFILSEYIRELSRDSPRFRNDWRLGNDWLHHVRRSSGNRVTTVGINPRLSDLKGPGTSKLDWRYLEQNKIDRNELQIHPNSQKGTGTIIAGKLKIFKKFERKKVKF